MTRDICISLGKRIRELRTTKGWNQIDLAEEAGINENYVSDLELGKKEVCLRTLQRIAHSLGVNSSEILRGLD
jgi:transcriptional regulator with XRE-family HTH domain